MTPTTGLRLYHKRHPSGTTALENPTGEMYSPNWTMNVMMYRKSRYLTLSAVIRKAGPRLANTASATKTGSIATLQLGQKPYHAIRANKIARLITKSTSATTADDA